MGREVLRVDGVSALTKKRLQESAMALYGADNASLLVRNLIDAHLRIKGKPSIMGDYVDNKNKSRVVLTLPKNIIQKADNYSGYRLSNKNYYLTGIIMREFEKPQLHGDEIEVLRRSNYEMAKIGTNLNQIAKAMNIIVKTHDGKMPELGKKIAGLRKQILSHTQKVLRVLNAGSVVFDSKGKGQLKSADNEGVDNG